MPGLHHRGTKCWAISGPGPDHLWSAGTRAALTATLAGRRLWVKALGNTYPSFIAKRSSAGKLTHWHASIGDQPDYNRRSVRIERHAEFQKTSKLCTLIHPEIHKAAGKGPILHVVCWAGKCIECSAKFWEMWNLITISVNYHGMLVGLNGLIFSMSEFWSLLGIPKWLRASNPPVFLLGLYWPGMICKHGRHNERQRDSTNC